MNLVHLRVQQPVDGHRFLSTPIASIMLRSVLVFRFLCQKGLFRMTVMAIFSLEERAVPFPLQPGPPVGRSVSIFYFAPLANATRVPHIRALGPSSLLTGVIPSAGIAPAIFVGYLLAKLAIGAANTCGSGGHSQLRVADLVAKTP